MGMSFILWIFSVSILISQYTEEWQIIQDVDEWGMFYFDLNGDETPELTKLWWNTVTFYDGVNDYTLSWQIIDNDHDYLTIWELYDFNADGEKEAVFISSNTIDTVTVSISVFPVYESVPIWTSSEYPGSINYIDAVDVDRDWQKELVFCTNVWSAMDTTYYSKVYVLDSMTGNEEWSSEIFTGYMTGPYVGDIDGDRTQEIMFNLYNYKAGIYSLNVLHYTGGAQLDFVAILTASDDISSNSYILTIGTNPYASVGFDEGMDQLAPPAPPPPAFDTALLNSYTGERYYIDLRPTTSMADTTEWRITFQSGEASNLFTIAWNPSELGIGSFILQDAFDGSIVSIDMKTVDSLAVNTNLTDLKIIRTIAMDVEIANFAGWNIVSLPLSVDDPSQFGVFPNSVDGSMYGFNGTYYNENELVQGEGYWLYFQEPAVNTISGVMINDLTVSLVEGWNLLGCGTEVIEIVNIADPGEIIVPGSIYGFEGAYQNVTTLNPGKGYWINAYSNGDIFLTGGVNKIKAEPANLPEKVNHLKINGIKLYFGIKVPEDEKLIYSLPPKPPGSCPDKDLPSYGNCTAGVFDARFVGDWKYTEDAGEIEIINDTDKLSISYAIVDRSIWLLINKLTGEEYLLEETGEFIVYGNTDKFILKKTAELSIPKSYTLFQNYPNPFNPRTTIKYSLPETNNVRVTIHDILGKEITELVHENMGTGTHKVVWDANNFSSGIYFIKMTTPDYIKTVKALLLK